MLKPLLRFHQNHTYVMLKPAREVNNVIWHVDVVYATAKELYNESRQQILSDALLREIHGRIYVYFTN